MATDSNSSFEPSDEARKLYEMHVQRAWADMQESSDQFDKQLLTISTGALGVSLAFIKDIVPLREAVSTDALFSSWGAFLLCILVTALSFLFSMHAQRVRVDHLDLFYLKGKKEFFNKKSVYTYLLEACRYLGILFLVLGLGLTVLFCYTNIVRTHL